MGTRHKHKNVDTTDSVILTYSWIKFNDVPLFYIICSHVAYKHLVSKFLIQQNWSPVPRTYVPTVLQLKPMHARLQWLNSDAWNGEREICVSCSSVFKHTKLSYMRHINTWHTDSTLLDRNFITRRYTVAKQLILFIQRMSRSRCL